MGFPTANIVADDQCQLIPASGAYAVKVSIGDDATWKAGMMNIGTRPTFDGNHQTLEVNIFDFDKDLYGKSLCVEFVSRLREERRFDSMEALREQLEKDEIQAKKELL
jgi:riboflavin kinase/FMN adenylyltransferase